MRHDPEDIIYDNLLLMSSLFCSGSTPYKSNGNNKSNNDDEDESENRIKNNHCV